MVICGDPNYISVVGFAKKKKLDIYLKTRLEKAHFQDKQYEYEFHKMLEGIEWV